jgi:hypothetical protein
VSSRPTPSRRSPSTQTKPARQLRTGQTSRQGVRLAEIITSLHERIREATERGWLGEIEGLQVSLQAARQKAEQVRRTRTRGIPVELGPTRATRPLP